MSNIISNETHYLVKDDHGNVVVNEENGILVHDSAGNLFAISSEDAREIFGYEIVPLDSEEFSDRSISSCPTQSQREITDKTYWSKEDTLQLIALYNENEHLFKSTTIRNNAVWKTVAESLKTHNAAQCENKFKYLKSHYIKKRDSMGPNNTGGTFVKFTFFDEMDNIFGKKPNVQPLALASSSCPTFTLEYSVFGDAMTRHARNCTAGAVYTYHEKKKDAQASGYGTNAQRLGKDSVKDFDCCSLSLQPCRNPVITKHGYLFDKEVILEYIIKKKNEYSRKLKEYERLKKKEEEESAEKIASEVDKKVTTFLKGENNIVSKPIGGFKLDGAASSSISNMADGREKELPSFWVPSKTPSAEKTNLVKPDPTILCPISQKQLKVKDLVDVKFTPVNDPDEKKSIHTRENRYMCAVTHDVLSNSVPCAVLRPTGDVVTMECVEKIIKKDWIHPLTNKKLTEKDIIVMQRGGTGYACTNENLQAKQDRPALQA